MNTINRIGSIFFLFLIAFPMSLLSADIRESNLSYSQKYIRILPGFSLEETTPIEQIIFLHIPKTAGTNVDSIARVFSQNGQHFHYQRLGVPRIEGRSPNLITPDWIGGLKRIENNPSLVDIIFPPFFIAGHFPYGLHRSFSEPSKYITLIRHPVDREVSDANFAYQRGYINKGEFKNYLIKQMIDNPQVRLIAGREFMRIPCTEKTLKQAKENIERHFLLAAPFEEVDTFIQYLASIQGWGSFAYAPMQITKKKGMDKIDPLLHNNLLQKHQWDLKLYEWVKSRFAQWKKNTKLIPKKLSSDEPIPTLMPDFLNTGQVIKLTARAIDSYNDKHGDSIFLELEQ